MRRTAITLAAALLGAAALLPSGSSAAEQGRFAAFLAPTNPVVGQGAAPFIERVEADSDGELTYKLFSGGALLGGKNMVDGLQKGVADIGQIVFGYYPAEFPHATLIADMAIYGSNPMAVAAAVTEFTLLSCAGCQAEFKRQGIVHLGATSTSSYALMARAPLTTVEDVQGKKIRTPGALWDRWVNAAGGTPVNISAGELYEAMTRGQIDAVLQPIGALKSHSLWDAAKEVTDLQLGTYRSWGIFSVSARHWQALTPAQRRILLDNAARGLLDAALGYLEADDAALAEAEAQGITLHEPAAALTAQVRSFLETDRAAIVENAKAKLGIAEPEPLMDAFIALVEKWEGLYAPLGRDVEGMAELLRQEVFAKIDETAYGL